jgi:uroporphyrin-III C-methyltransferase / precorrin-2 dehydrogenase / sirohydrochlorin ferrochelatase
MDYLPIFLKLENRLTVVIGGGEVAARKLDLLCRAGARIRVVAPELNDEVAGLAASGRIEHLKRGFVPGDLDGAELVIAATDEAQVNEAVALAARARHLPVNVVDSPDLCSFIMPAIIDRGRIVAAVSTGGASPVLARLIRARIELVLPHGIERLAALASSWRERVKAAVPEGVPRRRFWERLFAPSSAERILDGDTPDLAALLAAAEPPRGRLVVIEVPRHDPEALTLRGVRLLQSADLVLFEAGMPSSILEFARRDADRLQLDGSGSSMSSKAEPAIAAGKLVVGLAFLVDSGVGPALATGGGQRLGS